jgi:hypothetical protein
MTTFRDRESMRIFRVYSDTVVPLNKNFTNCFIAIKNRPIKLGVTPPWTPIGIEETTHKRKELGV